VSTPGSAADAPAAASSEAVQPGAPWRWYRTPDRRLLGASVALQLALATLFGHSYDTRVFMAAGYMVGTGRSPYTAQDLGAVFHHTLFDVMTTVGYPPPWPLVTGVLYRLSYAFVPDLLVYNLVLKLPVIAATIALAYLVASVLGYRGASATICRRAWLLLLFNPLLLFTGAAWGQIDVVVALLALASLVLVWMSRDAAAAALLALAVCTKPTALPIVLVVLVFLGGRSWRRLLRYAVTFVPVAVALVVLPFLVLDWSPDPIVHHWNAQFSTSGAMAPTTVVRALHDQLPRTLVRALHGPLPTTGGWWLLGLAWVAALAIAVVALRRGIGDFEDLLRKSVALVLVFFLTRTWLSETNVVLALPLVLVLSSLGALPRHAFTALWGIPLTFAVFNAAPLQLLFVAFPGAMARALAAVDELRPFTLTARAALVVAWQVAGWWVVVGCFRRRGDPLAAEREAIVGATP
jgi:hypothetical protein